MDTIRLTFPVDSEFRAVPTLVLGGVGARLDLPYERMDDLQLAVLTTLDAVDASEAIIEVEVDDVGITVAIGPLGSSPVSGGLDRVLSRLVDEHATEVRGGDRWISLRLERAPQPAS